MADGLLYQEARIKEGAAEGTLAREWHVPNAALNLAVRAEYLDKNRLAGCPRPKGHRRERVATPEEVHTLLSNGDQEFRRMVAVGLTTGQRLGMILKLRRAWLKQREDGFWLNLSKPTTKKRHPEWLPLNREAVAALDDPLPSLHDERIFRRWNPRSFNQYWTRLCARHGIHDLTFHDLRHTFSTMLRGCGVLPHIREELIGHSQPGMRDYYAHPSGESMAGLRDAVERLTGRPLGCTGIETSAVPCLFSTSSRI